MIISRSRIFFTLLLSLITLSGCYSSDVSNSVGNYYGILTEKIGAKTTQSRITAELTAPDTWEVAIKVQSSEGNRTWTFGIVSGRRATTFNWREGGVSTALRPADNNCYINADARDVTTATTRICYDGHEATLELAAQGNGPALTFVATHARPGEMPILETPGTYTVSKLVERSMNQSFNSQVEFEHVVQARLTSQNAHLNLLPHFTANTLLGFISFSALGLVKSIGDLAPFLLPTRWFRAKEASFKSVAEYDAWILMKADSANITEGLAYAIARDTKSITRMEGHRANVAAIRRQIYIRERLGLLPRGATQDFDAVLNAVDQSLLFLHQMRDEEYTSLAQASGFFNPRAIQDITLDDTASILQPELINPDEVAQQALDRAYELKQMDALIEVARLSHKSSVFNWLDPAGDSSGAIGFGFGSYLAIGASQVREMKNQRQQLQALLLKKVADTTSDIQDSINSHALSKEGLRIHASRVQRMRENLRLGEPLSLTDLANAVQDEMRSDLDQVNSEFAYLVSRSKVNRLLYTGLYANVAGQVAPPRP